MTEAHEVRKIMHLLPGNGLFGIPVFEQFLDARLVSHRLDALMAAYAFLHRGNTRHQTATGIGMAIHAIDFHPALVMVTGMAEVRELNRLRDSWANIIRA